MRAHLWFKSIRDTVPVDPPWKMSEEINSKHNSFHYEGNYFVSTIVLNVKNEKVNAICAKRNMSVGFPLTMVIASNFVLFFSKNRTKLLTTIVCKETMNDYNRIYLLFSILSTNSTVPCFAQVEWRHVTILRLLYYFKNECKYNLYSKRTFRNKYFMMLKFVW